MALIFTQNVFDFRDANILSIMRETPTADAILAPLVIVLFSGDRKLVRAIASYAKKIVPNLKWLLLTVEPVQYISACLKIQKAELDRERWLRDPPELRMRNFIKGAYTHVPIQVVEFIRDQVKLIGSRHYTAYFEYDYPNIERHFGIHCLCARAQLRCADPGRISPGGIT